MDRPVVSGRRPFRVLTINGGSWSVKFAVFDTSANTRLFESVLERVGHLELGDGLS